MNENSARFAFRLCFVVFAISCLVYGYAYGKHSQQRACALAIKNIYQQHQNELAAVTAKERARAIENFRVEIWEATGYAPLDPDAVNGICYAGDPNITASGQPVYPGVTVAAGPDIPFGTWLWIEGFGWRRVDDRGGKIKNGRVDICFISRQEALKFGRQKVVVVIPEWDEEGEN